MATKVLFCACPQLFVSVVFISSFSTYPILEVLQNPEVLVGSRIETSGEMKWYSGVVIALTEVATRECEIAYDGGEDHFFSVDIANSDLVIQIEYGYTCKSTTKSLGHHQCTCTQTLIFNS